MKIELKGREFEFSFDSVWGPMYTYEDIAGDKLPFDPRKTLCMHILFYCILLRANKGFDLTFDEFVESLNDLETAAKMKEYYLKRMDVLSTGVEAVDEDGKKKD